MLAPLLDTNAGVRVRRGHAGRPRRRPSSGTPTRDRTTRGAAASCIVAASRCGSRARGIEDSSRLGRVRWVVERTMAWLLGFRRLALRYDRTQTTLSPLLTLACALICHCRLLPDRLISA
jgi:hypothetical protein